MSDKLITLLSLFSGAGIVWLVIYYFYRAEELREKIEKLEKGISDEKKINSELSLDELVNRSNESRGVPPSGEDPK